MVDYELDTLNYKKKNNPKARETLLKYMEKLDLLDIWRHTHETTKNYTWRQNFYKKFARLDYFLISESLLDIYASSKIKTSYKSDHCPVQSEGEKPTKYFLNLENRNFVSKYIRKLE